MQDGVFEVLAQPLFENESIRAGGIMKTNNPSYRTGKQIRQGHNE